jgi:hypothetical protein
MTITKEHVQNLIHLLTFGLIHGAGSEYEAHKKFCVQQAVHKVIRGDLESYRNDHPAGCINEELLSFGIRLNDHGGWKDNQRRAAGLKRFAIAEMGTAQGESNFSMSTFNKKLCEKLQIGGGYGHEIIDLYLRSVSDSKESTNNKLTHIANASADVLKEMETPGSKFLYLVDEPDKEKRKTEAHKFAQTNYAAQMASITPCSIGGSIKAKHKH